MSEPRVSVVIPAHNSREMLRTCLQHLSAQDLPPEDFEVIVVDDASTDGTAQSAVEMGSKLNLSVVRREVNGGPGAARNSGIRASHGEVIALVDADTEPDPGWLREGLEATAGADVVEGCTVIESREKITPFTHQTENIRPGGFPTCNMFFRRSVFGRVGLFDERFYDCRSGIHFREDTDLALRAIEAGLSITFAEKARVVHRPLAPKWNRPIHLAKRYRHDRLLRQLHPATFSNHTDVWRVGSLLLRRPRQKLYWGYLAGVAAVVICAVAGVTIVPAIVWTLAFLAGTWWMHVRAMGGRALGIWGLAAVPVAAVVPFVFASAILAGVRLHPNDGSPSRPVEAVGEPALLDEVRSKSSVGE